MSKNNTRTQQFALVLYSFKDLETILSYGVKRFAYIKHSDIDDSNLSVSETPISREHYHLFVSFSVPRKPFWLDWFKISHPLEQNVFCQKCSDLESLLLYFTHDKDKYPDKLIRYSINDIVSNFPLDDIDVTFRKRADTLEVLKSIAAGSATWLSLFESEPNLIFSSVQLKSAYELIRPNIDNSLTLAQYRAFLKKLDNPEFSRRYSKFLSQCKIDLSDYSPDF